MHASALHPRLITILAAAVTVTLMAPSAHASATDDTRTITVRYEDLNIATDAGAKALYRRISAAARAVCSTAASVSPRLDSFERQQCIERSMRDAVAAVGSPVLTAWVARRAGSDNGG